MTRTRATYGCCHAPVVGGVDPQHKCNTNRAGGNGMANHAPTRNAAASNARGVHAMESARGVSAARRQPTSRPGRAAEDAMAEALAGAGYVVQTYSAWLRTAVMTGAYRVDAVREFPVGLLLDPPRKYRADFYLPTRRLAVEVKGLAHAAGRRKVNADIEREGLLAAAGVRVLPVSPESVMDGTALALVRAAMGGA